MTTDLFVFLYEKKLSKTIWFKLQKEILKKKLTCKNIQIFETPRKNFEKIIQEIIETHKNSKIKIFIAYDNTFEIREIFKGHKNEENSYF